MLKINLAYTLTNNKHLFPGHQTSFPWKLEREKFILENIANCNDIFIPNFNFFHHIEAEFKWTMK